MKWFNSLPARVFAAALATGGFAGCIIDPIGEGPGPDDSQDVQITVDIPAPTVPSTRAGLHFETAVESVDILVFKKNATAGQPDVLAERVVGTNLRQSDSEGDDYRVTFLARLTPNADATTIAVIADASAAVTAALATAPVGSPKQSVLAALKYDYGQNGDVPMYGEKALTGGIKPEMRISGVSLVRALARIDIENEAANFEITSVYVSAYDIGYIAPAWNTTTGALLSELPNQPMIPTGAAWDFTGIAGSSFSEMYYHETPKSNGIEGSSGHINSACLVIAGRLNGNTSKTHYYRVDFTEETDAAGKKPGEAGFDPSTVAYLPLLRNHIYKVNITAVTGDGYGNNNDARRSLGTLSNLKTTLHVIDQSGIKNMVFNGQHYIGIETDELEIPGVGGDVSVDVSSNYYRGWETRRTQSIEYIDGANWIKAADGNNFAIVRSGAAGRFPLPFKVDPNLTADPRTAYVHIALYPASSATSRLVHKIKVTQGPHIPVPELIVSPAELIYDFRGGARTITVSSTLVNGDPAAWEIAYDTDGDGFDDPGPDWLTIAQDGGLGTGGVDKQLSAAAVIMPGVIFSEEDETLKVANGAIPVNNETGSVRYNLAGVDGSETTANCYVINTSGRYKLPLVYGNALVGGADNRSAYTYNNSTSAGQTTAARDDVLKVFKNHLGGASNTTTGDISSPWISAHAAPDNATLVWQDSPDLITGIGLEGGYLVFDVKDANIRQGNAIVAVRQGQTILWSWHIWVTLPSIFDADASIAANTFQTTGKYPEGNPTRYRMMNHNLGWVMGKEGRYGEGANFDQPRSVTIRITQTGISDPAPPQYINVTQEKRLDLTRGNNPFYMWGRKDPLRPSNGGIYHTTGRVLADDYLGSNVATIIKPVFWGPDYINVEADPDMVRYVAKYGRTTLGNAIQEPYVVFTAGNWITDSSNRYSYNNLWDADNYIEGEANQQDYQSVKTIYDPSPVGYKVPVPDAWSNFPTSCPKWTNSLAISNSGVTFGSGQAGDGTSFFPASGERGGRDTGKLVSVGEVGVYWTALPATMNDAYWLRFSYVGYVHGPSYEFSRNNGSSMRPVAE